MPHCGQVVKAHVFCGAMKGAEGWEIDVGGERKSEREGREEEGEREDQLFFSVGKGENEGFAALSLFSGGNSAKRATVPGQH